MRYRHLCVSVALITSHSVCFAQGTEAISVEEAADIKLSNGKATIGNDAPADRAGSAINGSLLQFSMEQGDTEATLALKFDLDRYSAVKSNRSGFWQKSALDLVVSATAPLDGNNGDLPLLSGDQLVTGSRLKVAITRTSALVNDGTAAQPYIFEAQRLCVRAETEKWADAKGTNEAKTLASLYRGAFFAEFDPPRFLAGPTIRDLAVPDKFGNSDGSLGKHMIDSCVVSDPRKLIGEYNKDQLEQFLKAIRSDKPMTFMGLDGSIGRSAFKTLDRVGFAVVNSDRNSWEIGAYYGMIGPDADWSIRARAVYGKAWKSPDEIQICRAITGTTNQECIKGPDGKPLGAKTGLVSFEARKLLTTVGAQRIGIAPQLTYRFEDKGFGVEVPVYLSTDKEGKLSGGLKFAYDSKSDDYGIGIFVGAPFSIFFQ